ncbi:hypothetical protein JCM10207_005560 [Rhodosporidiobolus poonsookiae]
MDGTSITGTLEGHGLSKRWSASDLLNHTSSLPPARPLTRSASQTRIRLSPSPASSEPTSRASSPTLPLSPDLRSKSPSPPAFSRRLSKPLIDAAYLAATPSTYVDFVRSTHPSLLAFFCVSVAAVISNKALLRGFFHGLIYALTTVQLACATLGTMAGERIGAYKATRVAKRHDRVLVLCALVFSLEILASNLALRLVPVPFHVSLRACSPILTLLLSVGFFRSTTTLRTCASLLLIVLGAALTSHHEDWTSMGSLILLASAVLLTTKSLLVTHILTARLALSPLDILARLSPLSMLHTLAFAAVNGEAGRLWRFVRSAECTRVHLLEIALNGALNFALVPLGLLAERATRPPALAVTTHAAQATTILCSLFAFGLRLSPLNFTGVALSLAGGVLFAKHDARDQEERGETPALLSGELPVKREKRAPD